MLTRALIVLLLILNIGVALWWATRDPAPAPGEIALPRGAQPLRLVADATDADAAPPPVADGTSGQAVAPASASGVALPEQVAPNPPPAAPAVAQCLRFGPFADAAAATRAGEQLRPGLLQFVIRSSRAAPRGWGVQLPGLTDREAANAMAGRLTGAGFTDHYLQPAGEGGGFAIALGRFGSEAAARRHEAALRAAGFEAVAEPVGDAGAARHWVDAALGEAADADALRRSSGAAQAERIECGSLAAAAP